MKSFEQLERLKKINCLVKEEKTGSPQEFASKLGISKSHLYSILEDLRIKGAPINYSRLKGSYYYSEEFEMELNYSLSFIKGRELKQIFGGYHLKNALLLFYESGRF